MFDDIFLDRQTVDVVVVILFFFEKNGADSRIESWMSTRAINRRRDVTGTFEDKGDELHCRGQRP